MKLTLDTGIARTVSPWLIGTTNLSSLHLGSSNKMAHCPAVGALSSHLSEQTPRKQRAEIWLARHKNIKTVNLCMVNNGLSSKDFDH